MGVNGSSIAAHLETVRSRSLDVSLPVPYEQWFSLLRATFPVHRGAGGVLEKQGDA